MNRWQIGNIKITQVVEVEAMGGTRFILPQATPEAIQPSGLEHAANQLFDGYRSCRLSA